MTAVLPQLERALIDACRAEQAAERAAEQAADTAVPARGRARSASLSDVYLARRPRGGVGLGSVVAVLASVLAVVVVAGGALLLVRDRGRSAPGMAGRPAGAQLLTPLGAGRFAVESGGLLAGVYPLGGSLYVVWQSMARGNGVELARIEPANGRVLASVRATGGVGPPALIDGALWWTAISGGTGGSGGSDAGTHGSAGAGRAGGTDDTVGSGGSGGQVTEVVRSDPRTLRRLSVQRLVGPLSEFDGTIAQAGPWTWVSASNGLDRFASASGQLTEHVPVPGLRRASEKVWSGDSASGPVLLTFEGLPRPAVARRDPVTGSVTAQARSIDVLEEVPGPPVGGRAWLAGFAGSRGVIGTLDVRSLRFAAAYAGLRFGAVQAFVQDGILWVTQTQGGPARNFCADPATGRRRGSFPLARDAQFLAAAGRYIYSLESERSSARTVLVRTPIPRACRA